MNLDYSALEFWLKASAVVAQVLTFIWLFWINKSKATNARIGELGKATNVKIGELEKSTTEELKKMALRLERLEADAKHAPTHEDLKRIHGRMDESMGETRELGGKLDAVIRTLGLIEEHLINKGR